MIYKKECPLCGATILGRPRCETDDRGNLYQIVDFTCPCGYGRIYNPKL